MTREGRNDKRVAPDKRVCMDFLALSDTYKLHGMLTLLCAHSGFLPSVGMTRAAGIF
jgi:hypothetical protein